MTWYRDPAQLEAEVRRHGNASAAARANDTPEPTVRRWALRHRRAQLGTPPASEAERPGAMIDGDNAVLVSRPNPQGTRGLQPEVLIREHGLDPADWTWTPRLNVWDALTGEGGITTLAQLRLAMTRRVRVDLLTPARAPGWTPPRRRQRARSDEPELVVVCSDPHHPYADEGLHRCVVEMLADIKPHRAYDLGDGLDSPNPSRHRRNPAFDATLQECLDAEYSSWRDRIAASPSTRWHRLPGNHDDRVRNEQLERTAALYGVRRAQVEAEIAEYGEHLPVLDIGYLLRLDELGVEMIRATDDGEYHHAQVRIAPGLVAGHGTKSGKHGGATKAGERLTCSWMQGHDHKQALAYLTRWDDERRAGDAALCSVGTLARRDLGYVEHAEAQQGLATVTVWPDGRFHIELARYDGGELVWRDRRYTVR